jgi:adenylate kinase family enzyme
MKLYIVGSVASGKSTLARRISEITGIPCHHLDEVVHMSHPTNSWGNQKRPSEERDTLFSEILACQHYIMEDVGRECFITGMQQADTVILLDIPLHVRKRRIFLRWIRQNLGIEKCIYRPQLAVLKSMFKWAMNYDKGIDGTKTRVLSFIDKTIILHNNKEINTYLKELKSTVNVPVQV